MENKKLPLYFSVLFRWEHVIDNLTDREVGKLLKAMYHYRTKGENPNFGKNDRLNIFWCDVVDWLDTSAKKYDDKVQQARYAGKKSAENRNQKIGIDNPEQALIVSDQNENENSASNEIGQAKSDTKDDEEDENSIVQYFKDTFVCYTKKDVEVIRQLRRRYGSANVRNGIYAGKKFGAKSASYVKKMLENAPNGEIDMVALRINYCKTHNDFF